MPFGWSVLFRNRKQKRTIDSLTLSDTADALSLALRIFRPACQVQVQLMEGRPASLASLARTGDQKSLQGKILWSAGHGVRPETGGPNSSPHRNDTEDAQAWNREEWDIALANDDGGDIASTGFIAIPVLATGLPMPAMTDTSYVHRAALPLSIQLPRRSIGSRGIGRSMPLAPNAGDGTARSRRSLWRSTLSSGHEKARPAGAYRRGDHFPAVADIVTSGKFARFLVCLCCALRARDTRTFAG